MSNDLQKKDLNAMLKMPNVKSRFEQVLGQKTNQFIASLLSLNNNSNLQKCDPHTVLTAAMTAATLDLPVNPNLGFAYIIPYKTSASFQMGYKGFIQLAMRTGQYAGMNALVINSDSFLGLDDLGEPIIDFVAIDDAKPAAGYFFAFRMINGFSKKVYWTRKKVESHAKQYSQAFRGGSDSPWNSNFDSMALKTVVKNTLSKWGYLSIDMQAAVEKDQSVEAESGITYPDNEPVNVTHEMSNLEKSMEQKPQIDIPAYIANSEISMQEYDSYVIEHQMIPKQKDDLDYIIQAVLEERGK